MFFGVVFGCTLATHETDIVFHNRKDKATDESAKNDELYNSLQELINSQCINCHGLGAEASGLNLTNNFCESVVNINSAVYTESLLVKPRSLEKSVFWHKIAATGEYGQGMPTMEGLSESEISLFEEWIENGANCIEENNSETVFLGTCAEEDLSSENLIDLDNGKDIHNTVCLYCHLDENTPPLESVVPVNDDDFIEEIVCDIFADPDMNEMMQLERPYVHQDFLDVLAYIRQIYPSE